ncbi:hypothetical protein [Bradyrhizobium sp. 144]|uniref:hypothetical protein n=1 Tax=Bradyrhizobium sp. 144 TaxID=2782620 RepID=UPI001FFB1918|nr:hypothetical protein [Bradyrhizobium sp. 144]MCK1693842.1 hypothetical protein [Bradyrhizobium sp. 144]
MENIRELPADSTRAILSGLGIQQRERARALSDLARLRKEASAEITRLIAFLDASDPYVMTELEEDISADLEDDDPAENDDPTENDLDDEPSLGSLDHHHSQERWAAGGRCDLEQDQAESGIGDLDGVLEQLGTQDWQQGAMA